jgi:hypothetical protein
MAKMLGVAPGTLYLNIPPSPNRYPGAIFLKGSPWIVIEPATMPEVTGQPVPGFSMEWTHANNLAESGTIGMGPVSELLRNYQELDVELKISDAQVFEMKAGDLKRRLLGSEDAVSAANKGNDPLIITRAWSGIFTLRLRTSGKLDANATAQVRGDAERLAKNRKDVEVELQGSQDKDGAVLVKLTTPTVFAFEAAAASYVNRSLATTPQDVKLVPLRVPEPAPGQQQEPLGRRDIWPTPRPPWALAAVSSGYYPSAQLLTQPWQPGSSGLTISSLSVYGPDVTERWDASNSRPLTAEALLNFAQEFGQKAKTNNNRFIVFYYIGHTYPLESGEIGLVMGTYDPRNYRGGDATQVLPLGRLYEQLAAAGLPFAMLIDGCYESGEFQRYVTSLGFTADPNDSNMDYVGDADVITHELGDFARGLRDFTASLPYMRDVNPVILAAKPGRVASEQQHPLWELERVGPLARKLAWWMELDRSKDFPLSLGELLRRTVDYNQTGEISAAGTISWSDFTRFRHVAGNVYPGPADNPVQPEVMVAPDTLVDISPAMIVDFVVEPITRNLLIRDDKFRLLRFGNGDTMPEVLIPEMLSVLGQTSKSAYVQDEQNHTLFKLGSDFQLIPVLENSFIDILGSTRSRDSLVAIESDSTIDTPDPIWHIQDAQASKVDRIEASKITDVVGEDESTFYFAIPEQGAILKRAGNSDTLLVSGLKEPTRLAIDDRYLYCLSGHGEYLYRVQRDGATEAVRLERYLSRPEGSATGRVLRLAEDGRLLLASGGALLALDSGQIAWQRL